MRYSIFFLFLFIALPAWPLNYHASQDPKSYVTHLRIQYNALYNKLEAEGKFSSDLSIYRAKRWDWGMMASLTFFIHPASDFFGHYPVDNLIGFIGFFGCLSDLFHVPGLDLAVYPLVHESSHLVDGYDRGNILTDTVFDSNEYLGFDLSYTALPHLVLHAGFIFYMYFPPSAFYVSTRPLLFRLHIGEEWTIPLNARLGYFVGSDVAVFYENEFHPAVNIATGLDFSTSRLLLHYEYQRGLGQDFRETHQRIGIELEVKGLLQSPDSKRPN